jgi:hypothetical protein
MYLVAMRTASKPTSNASAGVEAAITATGDSPLRPYMHCKRSACCVFVGMPVLGPARCTLSTTSGSSAITARPIASLFSAMPGPEVDVTPRQPAYEPPIAAATAAISSSAWNVITPRCL